MKEKCVGSGIETGTSGLCGSTLIIEVQELLYDYSWQASDTIMTSPSNVAYVNIVCANLTVRVLTRADTVTFPGIGSKIGYFVHVNERKSFFLHHSVYWSVHCIWLSSVNCKKKVQRHHKDLTKSTTPIKRPLWLKPFQCALVN